MRDTAWVTCDADHNRWVAEKSVAVLRHMLPRPEFHDLWHDSAYSVGSMNVKKASDKNDNSEHFI
jgi:hypothetical protein